MATDSTSGNAPKDKVAAKQTKPGRVELKPPSHPGISWFVLLAYLYVFVEGVALCLWTEEGLSNAFVERVTTAQFHLCSIYVLEVVIALGPGWCAMSPGWTLGELIAHHGPYVVCVSICFWLNQQRRPWILPLQVVLLTPLNEALFIVQSLGAPGWVAKARRAFGFSIIIALMISEIVAWARSVSDHWAMGRDGIIWGILDQLATPAIYYHFNLLCMYVKRWRKTGTL
eukprot:TRINITY_DN32037_c0_g1_i1.p1 TRINITY_DN32037_c0_g1~~TRINITY_DN32037_c0_g1_i1.p1  ORF type:complete len:241 (+),score=30.18 TRINITY_DN32037_c0_g1_i1:41-724(+)